MSDNTELNNNLENEAEVIPDNVIVLRKPVTGLSGEITRITLNEITGGMFMKHGAIQDPVINSNDPNKFIVRTNMDAFYGYLVDCTGLPKPVLSLMDVADLKAAEKVLVNFFDEIG